jgi:hypothetical protein
MYFGPPSPSRRSAYDALGKRLTPANPFQVAEAGDSASIAFVPLAGKNGEIRS